MYVLVCLLQLLIQGELEIHKAFTSAEFVEKLVGFLSLEENKGSDRYNSKRVNMFKVSVEMLP